MALLLLLSAALAQEDPRAEYEKRAAEVKSDRERMELAEWAEKQRLWDLALRDYRKLGATEKIKGKERLWTCRAAVAKGLKFPSREELEKHRKTGKSYAAAVDALLDLDVWVAALLRIDERTGLFDGTLEIEIKLSTWKGGTVRAHAGGKGGRGSITFDIAKLARHHREVSSYDRMKKVGAAVSVRPASMATILGHELAHCFQDDRGPFWFREGMATFCAPDEHFRAHWRKKGRRTGPITDPVDPLFLYARSLAFFEHFDAVHGREKLRHLIDRVVRKRERLEAAAAAVTGKPWDDLVAEEEKWSRDWLGK